MKIKQIYQIYEDLETIDMNKKRKLICKNMKKYRLELYDRYKEEYKRRGSENPYSTENISAYLDISDDYYRKLESESNQRKYISIDSLIKLSYILDKKLDDFFKE